MASSRTFYHTLMSVEILSENPLRSDESLSDIVYLIEDGQCSGKIEIIVENEEVDGPRMAQLLQEQASDPEYFGLDNEGNDIDDNGEENSNSEHEECEEQSNHVYSMSKEKIVLCRGHSEARRVNGQTVEEGDPDKRVCQDCYKERSVEMMAREPNRGQA